MKTIDIFCHSQASTTTITMDSNIPSSSTTTSNSSRAIDRHNPIIQDQKRLAKTLLNTLSNKKKIRNPKSDKNDQKRKNIAYGDENSHDQQIVNKNVVKRQGGVLLGWGCTKPSDFISPATSSRFLLADKTLLSDQFDPLLKPPSLPPSQPDKIVKPDSEKSFKKEDDVFLTSSPAKTAARSSSSLSSTSSEPQVVVLRVSLHCRGCEKKMRKHISKMEGVTSFTIDFMAKKVTVIGDVTPLSVLTSVSKVKNAKLLTPTTISPSNVPPNDTNLSDIKKQLGIVV